MKTVERLLHPSLRAGDAETQRRARLLLSVTLILLGPNVAFSLFFLVTRQAEMLGPCVCIAAALLGTLALIRWRGNLTIPVHLVAGTYMLVLFRMSFEFGGLSEATVWVFSVIAVLFAYLTGGKRAGLIWTAAHGAAFAIHVGLAIAGVRLVSKVPQSLSMSALSILCFTVVLVGIVTSYEASKERALEAVREQGEHARLILDNIGEGYLLVRADGSLTDERSRAVEAAFGAPTPGQRIWDYLGGTPDEREIFAMSWEALVEGAIPREILIEQMPSTRKIGARTHAISYRLVLARGSDAPSGVVLVVRDVTAELIASAAKQERLEQGEVMHRVFDDPSGFAQFLAEARAVVARLQGPLTQAEAFRGVHTLKGNAALIGAMRLATTCHALEDRLAVAPEALDPPSVAAIAQQVESLAELFEPVVRSRAHLVEATLEDVETLRRVTAASGCAAEVVGILDRWGATPVQRELRRLAERARSMAARLEKEVAVTIDAPALDLPQGALDGLWPALAHLVRNAVDHGIEAPAVRLARGKPRAGGLRLSARRDGPDLVVAVSDDGAGIDWARVRARAIERGLPAETQDDLAQALLADGLSTRDEASVSSGRGVGTSAVVAEAAKLGGGVTVRSQPGLGATFEVRVRVPAAVAGRRAA